MWIFECDFIRKSHEWGFHVINVSILFLNHNIAKFFRNIYSLQQSKYWVIKIINPKKKLIILRLNLEFLNSTYYSDNENTKSLVCNWI